MNSTKTENFLNTALDILSNSRTEEIRETICNNQEFCDCFKRIDDRLNELLPIVPKDARNSLYEIESAVNEIVSISNDITYRRGFQDSINLLLEMMGKRQQPSRKPKYLFLECESRRKDAHRPYGGKTGWVYKIARVLKEYTSEVEAERDLVKLKAGEIAEDELTCRGVRSHEKRIP